MKFPPRRYLPRANKASGWVVFTDGAEHAWSEVDVDVREKEGFPSERYQLGVGWKRRLEWTAGQGACEGVSVPAFLRDRDRDRLTYGVLNHQKAAASQANTCNSQRPRMDSLDVDQQRNRHDTTNCASKNKKNKDGTVKYAEKEVDSRMKNLQAEREEVRKTADGH